MSKVTKQELSVKSIGIAAGVYRTFEDLSNKYGVTIRSLIARAAVLLEQHIAEHDGNLPPITESE